MAYTISTTKFFQIGNAVRVSTRDHDEVRPAEHPGLEINFDFTNVLPMLIDGRPQTAGPANILICNGRVPHLEIHHGTSESHKAIVIQETTVASFLGDQALARELVFKDPVRSASPTIVSLARKIFSLRESPYVSEILTEFLFDDLTLAILGQHEELYHGASYHRGVIHRAKTKIISEFRDPDLSMTKIAQDLGLSKFHFLRTFKKETGYSPCQYLMRLRTESLKVSLATNPSERVIDLALEAGFPCLNSCYVQFRKQAALSPMEFARKRLSNIRREEGTFSALLEPVAANT